MKCHCCPSSFRHSLFFTVVIWNCKILTLISYPQGLPCKSYLLFFLLFNNYNRCYSGAISSSLNQSCSMHFLLFFPVLSPSMNLISVFASLMSNLCTSFAMQLLLIPEFPSSSSSSSQRADIRLSLSPPPVFRSFVETTGALYLGRSICSPHGAAGTTICR